MHLSCTLPIHREAFGESSRAEHASGRLAVASGLSLKVVWFGYVYPAIN